ncbi:MAG: helix-turn-helix transcriptional regulator [Pseudomonadota bacterium]
MRLRKGITQMAMADAADIDRTYASGIERALRNVSLRNVQRIADALDVDVRVLFDPALAAHPLWGGDLPPKVGV